MSPSASSSQRAVDDAFATHPSFSSPLLRSVLHCDSSGDLEATVAKARRCVVDIRSRRSATHVCALQHARPVVYLAWRSNVDGVLVTRTTDGVARIWAPVIDEPHALRMVSAVDSTPAGPALYLDAAHVSMMLQTALQRLHRDLGVSTVSELNEREQDLKRSRARRLEHLLHETPDLFLCPDQQGTLVVKAIANIDRRPPTLCETFTVLKLYDVDGRLPWKQVRSASLVPEQMADEDDDSDTESCYEASACLVLSTETDRDGSNSTIDDNESNNSSSSSSSSSIRSSCTEPSTDDEVKFAEDRKKPQTTYQLLLSPALLFDGLHAGLRLVERGDFFRPGKLSERFPAAFAHANVSLRTGPLQDLREEILFRCMLRGELATVLSVLRDVRYTQDKRLDSEDVRHVTRTDERPMPFPCSPSHRRKEVDAVMIDEDRIQTAVEQHDEAVGSAKSHLLRTAIQVALDLRRMAGQLDDYAMHFIVARTYANALSAVAEAPGVDDALRATSDGYAEDGPLLDGSTSKAALYARRSETQEALVKHLETIDGGAAKMTWSKAREMGLFLWLRTDDATRRWAEHVARASYTAGEERDPSSCAPFYYALGKGKLMVNLWRQAIWHPEQRKMLQFLQNDFDQPRWRSAALKNAFALLSQRRFTMAASFFLLGDSLQDAVNVCTRNLNDAMLAVALCRMWQVRDTDNVSSDPDRSREGHRVLVTLLTDHLLPQAESPSGSRWLVALTRDMLNSASTSTARRATATVAPPAPNEAALPSTQASSQPVATTAPPLRPPPQPDVMAFDLDDWGM